MHSNLTLNTSSPEMLYYNTVVYSFESSDLQCTQPPVSMCRTIDSTEECFGDPMLLCVSTISQEDTPYLLCSACDPGTFGSPDGNCSACAPGLYSQTPATTTCLECAAGEFSAWNASSSCTLCEAGAYSPYNGSTACIDCTPGVDFELNNSCVNCTAECGIGFHLQGVCTAVNDSYCAPCPEISNCIYTTMACGNSSHPNCECVAGFELISGECRVCQVGFFKNHTSQYPCEEWALLACSEGFYPINGTRFHDSICQLCPDIPNNSTAIIIGMECGWGCDAGFNNTLEKKN
jgi:hypothetical protein